ncbi:MAG: FHA domain-containing protein, partial [Terriglobales bacterium]
MGQVIQLPTQHKRTFSIEKRNNLIGRSDGNNVILLGDRTISRQHAVIGYDRAIHRYFVTDCKSQNGTAVNGRPVKGTMLLNHGDEVRFGCTNLVFWTGTGRAWLETPDAQPVTKDSSIEEEKVPTY